MWRMMHKNCFRNDSPVLYFCLCESESWNNWKKTISRTHLQRPRAEAVPLEEQAVQPWRSLHKRRPVGRFLYTRSSIAAPQIPAQASGWLQCQPPRTTRQQHCPIPEKRCIRRRRSRKLCSNRGTNLLFFRCPSGWLLLLLCFTPLIKTFIFWTSD